MTDIIDKAKGFEATSLVSGVMNKIVSYFETFLPDVSNLYV